MRNLTFCLLNQPVWTRKLHTVYYLAIKYPGGREDKGDVAGHVDHASPVDGEAADIIESHHDVGDDGVL